MKQTNWREIVEIVGVISIVGSLLLLATEVRQSNRIATAEMEVSLAERFMDMHVHRYSNTDVAKLWIKIVEPEGQLITATDHSQMRGITWVYINLFWMAQIAHDNELMADDVLEVYVGVVRWILEHRPALQEHFIFIYGSQTDMEGARIFAPIGELIRKRNRDNNNDNQ
ncbi:MAG: hypothetical protein IID59_11875 [Proteobacteria bacterium]|nr:hypothetical protein [Pseudomonadota bacterium]